MSYSYDEIRNQPASWEQTLAGVGEQWTGVSSGLNLGAGTSFLFVGCGTSLYIAQSAAQSWQEVTGYTASAVPGSEVFLSPESVVPRDAPTVAFVISRSGTTSEAVMAARFMQQLPNAQVVGITCNSGTPLAEAAPRVIELPWASERSVVMTQSFTNMLLALQAIAALVASDSALLAELSQLPSRLRELWSAVEEFGRSIGQNLDLTSFIYLGLGPNYGLAQEATLKLKEMTQVPVEGYNPLEFRHGPISTVRPGTAVVLLEGLREQEYAGGVEADVKRHGAYVATISPYGSEVADRTLVLPDELSDVARCCLYLSPTQLLAYYRALALGLDPDAPRNLTQVVVLDAH